MAFLRFVKEAGASIDQHKAIRFGNGGLIGKLQEFVSIEVKAVSPDNHRIWNQLIGV
ncbi:hypothetical protein JNUCC23_18600 [Peribacillus sp. JNUCC 23]